MTCKAARFAVSALALFAFTAFAEARAGAVDVSHVAAANTQSALPANWNHDAAFMEIFVRSYKDSDGDGIGDFKGLTSQLDYVQSLGVTGIWLMPIGPSEDHDHGYAVNDYRAIDPDYGTMADFDAFIAEAHKRGIGVILDFVINHSGSGNPIFKDAELSKASPYRDWYIFRDKVPPWHPGLWGPFRKDDYGDYVYGVFSDQMPDWNLRNPKVVTYLQDSMRFWMNKGVDGFRLDAVTMLIENGPTQFFNQPENPGIVAQLKSTLDQYDNRYLICEASEKPEMYLGACNAFAYGTQGAIIGSAKKGVLQDGLVKQLQSPNRDKMPLALQSHDSYVGDRLINQFGVNGQADYKVAAMISILASRTPFSYYGEEIGMSNGGTFNDSGLRSPMSWTGTVLKQRSGSTMQDVRTAGFTTGKPYRNVAINVASQNVADEAGDPASLLETYRSLYTVRRAHPVIGTGDMNLQSKTGDPSLIFTRSDASDEVAVLINLGDAAQSLTVDTGAPGMAFVQALLKTGDPQSAPVMSDANGHLTATLGGKSAAVYVKVK